ncbi:MAG: undecaprenyl-diphosphate phosphatase [Muribaculaceae bacterium]|nr:undecaprenyl-diphosphate phosphatase [Muribaculaceae bacterium]MDE6316754.1 undecaprenyl-diphosphate phosphatase [Muribaculaceae bacterium]
MDWIDALILGIIQGLSEYLPISSSGHLEIFKQVLGVDLDPDASLEFSVMLHVATVLSTIVVLWREFWPLCVSFFTFRRDDRFFYVCKILLSCIPVAIVGLFFKDAISALFEGNLKVVGACLLVTAALLAFAYFTRTEPALKNPAGAKPARDITWLDAFIIGCGQAVAVLPGLSRSGTTIATGILLGDKREQVAKFSFFMVIIPILGEGLLDIKEMISPDAAAVAAGASVGMLPLLTGFLASFIVGCMACKWMIDIVKKGKLVWFAVYCVAAGALCLLY